MFMVVFFSVCLSSQLIQRLINTSNRTNGFVNELATFFGLSFGIVTFNLEMTRKVNITNHIETKTECHEIRKLTTCFKWYMYVHE